MQNSVVSREEWLQHRRDLLQQEKAHTREGDRLSRLRRELPRVKIEKRYEFTGADGTAGLSDLFADCSQLLVYHFMFGADWDKPCPGCSAWADAFNGTTEQFRKADARLLAISRAPYEKLAAEQQRRGWNFPWFSSAGSNFNVDFYASTEDLNETSRHTGAEEVHFDRGENHGISVFIRNDQGDIFHTYSCYNRGIEAMNGAMGYLDLLPAGRTW